MAAAPLSTAIGSPISGALMELPRFAGLANWQWLYILEALPAILLGFVTLKVLTDAPEQAAWLSAEECAWLVQTLAAERVESVTDRSSLAAVWAMLREPRVLALAMVYSGTSAGLYAIGFWAPLLIKQCGFSAMTVGWLNALPSVVAVMGMVVWARHSDGPWNAAGMSTIPCFLGCVGLVWAGYAQAAPAVILALAVASFGVNGSKGAAVGDSRHVPVGRERGGGDCADQLDWEPGRIRRAAADWVAQGPMGKLSAVWMQWG